MKSPFPGMDPYLEQFWGDVHSALVVYTRDQLQPCLPESLRARVEERVFLETENGAGRTYYPDVHVVEHRPPSTTETPSETAVAEPLIIRISGEPRRQGFVEIIDAASGNRVVTVIEFLSPTNKLPGEGRNLYLRKQQDVLKSDSNLVEIDLTRVGDRALAVGAAHIPPSHQSTYQACVRRSCRPLDFEFYALPLRQALPKIRIPLRETDDDVSLNLQALIDQCYKNGRYDSINYKHDPQPPLDDAERVWIDELLRSKGVR